MDEHGNPNARSQDSCPVTSTSNCVPYFDGSYNDFFYEFLTCNMPVVIPKVTSHWKCFKLWVRDGKPNIDYLRSQYGNATVSVADCNQKYFNAQLKTEMKFHDFADYWEKLMQNNCQSTERCLYLKDWHFTRDFPKENVYVVPPQFCSDWLNEYFVSHPNLNDDYRFVYMGPKGSWTPLHADVFSSYSWSVNVCGEKRWILLEPGEENKLKDHLRNLPYDISFLEDFNDNMSHLNVKHRIIIQNAGDAIFVPSGWYHQVWNMQDTISINHNWVNGCNIENMWKSMKKNLEEVKNEVAEFQHSMEDWPHHCQIMLKSCFGMDFKDFYDFIQFILRRRKQYMETNINLRVHGDQLLGLNHVEYDFTKAKTICDIFESDPDVRILLAKGYILS